MKLINAIISEDKEAFVQSFRESMAEKVNAILEAKKVEVAKMSITDKMDARDVHDHKIRERTKRAFAATVDPAWKERMADRHDKLTKKYGKGYMRLAGISKEAESHTHSLRNNADGVHELVKKRGTKSELARTNLVRRRQGNGTDNRLDDAHLEKMVRKYSDVYYEEVEQIDEVKQFRTAYGWAGGRNERTGGVHKMNPGGPNAFQAIASHFKQHLKTNYGLKKAKHENQVGQHMHWIDTNSDGPLDHEGIIAAAKQLDPNAQTSIETRTNKLGPGYGDSEGTHHNTLLTIKGQYKNKPFELTHSNSSWEPGKYEPGQLRLSIHKNELSRAGMDQGLVSGDSVVRSTRR